VTGGPESCKHPAVAGDIEREVNTDVRGAISRYDPYWGAQLVVGAAILLDLSLSEKLTIGPTWLIPSLEVLALIALTAASSRPSMRDSGLRRQLSLALIGIVTAANCLSLVLLCTSLLRGHPANGRQLIGSGIVLWVTNVLLFGIWFWQMDRGGPGARARGERDKIDFLFVQMSEPKFASPGWEPSLIDYLYTSFTNATAFSPTDTMPLTGTAKSLMAAQALTALATIGLVVARAVNIL
jgi:hypothetical protein